MQADPLYYLQQMGIDVWELRKTAESPSSVLAALAQEVAVCTRCPLHATRTQTVFSRGNVQAAVMVIGEAPGFHEDREGAPFVGKAGRLLDQMLQSIGLTENEVYIANALKCRPPGNRDPKPDEIAMCADYLRAQVEAVDPKVILAVGRFAGQFLLNSQDLSLSQMRSRQHDYQGRAVFVSYHPAYLLRNPADKKKAFVDLMRVQQVVNQ